jgi:ribose transport system permease protein
MSDVASTTRLATASRGEAFRANLPSGWGNAVTVAGAWIALIVVSGLHRADFLSHQTVLAISFTMAIVGILAVAQALVGISGGILDLSQPTGLTLAASVVAKLLQLGVPVAAVVVAGIAVGAAWGFLNALIIVYGKLNPIIVTLATNFIGGAIMFLIYQNIQAPLRSAFSDYGRTYFLGLPNIWWPMVVLVLLVGFFLPRTRYGRHVIAVGGNRFAAQARGISLKKTRFAVFTISGAIVGLAGILFAASNGPFAPTAGATFQLPVIASVILAGVSLAGGRGSIWLILLSVGFLSTIPTSLVFFGFSSNWQAVFQGSILIIAVAIDGSRAKRLQQR